MILDHNGKPIRSADLRVEQGGATTSGLRSPYRSSIAAGLRPERLARLLRAADDGDTTAYYTLAEEMEERELHYRSTLTTRKLGVSGAPFTVQAATDMRRDQKIADDVRVNVIESPLLGSLVFDMLDALGKGHSLVEIMWDFSTGQAMPVGYEWRDPRWFVWDRESMSEPLIITDRSPNGEPLAPGKWIHHTPKLKSGLPLRGGLARPVSIAYALKSYCVRDLMAYLETYGIPFRYGTYRTGATQEEQDKLLEAVTCIGSDASGIVPDSTKIEFIASSSKSGSEAFIGTAEYWDKQISKVVLGQTMTTDEGKGKGKAQASEQSKQKLEIKRHDASRAAATLRQQLVTTYVRLNYGPDALITGIACETRSDEELDMRMTSVERYVGMGGKVEMSVVRDMLGLPDPERDKDGNTIGELLTAPNASAAPAADPNAPQNQVPDGKSA